MAVELFYMPTMVFRDANDAPLAGAKVYSFAAGTSTPLAMYQDSAGATPHANPAVCDGSGRLIAYGTVGTAYKIDVFTSTDVHVSGYPIDNVLLTPRGDPTLIDDYELNVAQSNETEDPGEPGSESLATNLAGMFKRLKFRMEEMTGVNWRQSDTVRTAPVGIGNYAIATGYPDGSDLTYQWFIHVPDGFVSAGPQSVKMYLSDSVASGSVRLIYQYTVIRDDATIFASGFTLAAWSPATTTKAYLRTFSITPSTFLPNDTLIFQLGRTGTHVDDTNTGGTVAFQGGFFSFTGKASR